MYVEHPHTSVLGGDKTNGMLKAFKLHLQFYLYKNLVCYVVFIKHVADTGSRSL